MSRVYKLLLSFKIHAFRIGTQYLHFYSKQFTFEFPNIRVMMYRFEYRFLLLSCRHRKCKKSRKLIENIGNIQTVPDSDSDTLN